MCGLESLIISSTIGLGAGLFVVWKLWKKDVRGIKQKC